LQNLIFGTHNWGALMAKLGILAFGSLIDHPGWEIEEAIIGRRHPHAVRDRVRATIRLTPSHRGIARLRLIIGLRMAVGHGVFRHTCVVCADPIEPKEAVAVALASIGSRIEKSLEAEGVL
jgi:hypothetical protein